MNLSVKKLFTCDTEKPQEVLPTNSIRSLFKLAHPYPITRQQKQKLKTVAVQDRLHKDTKLSLKYKEKTKLEFETLITVSTTYLQRIFRVCCYTVSNFVCRLDDRRRGRK